MKKGLIIALLGISILVAGCGSKEEKDSTEIHIVEESEENQDSEIKSDEMHAKNEFDFANLENIEFYFASGAGGWRTVMQIEEDGSFSGEYSDSDMGSTGDDHPNGTLYYCKFEGKFAEPVKVNEYTYSMKIEEISCANEADAKEIKDGTLYYYSTPYGLDGAEEVLIYLPGAPTKELPQEYMNWVKNDMENPDALELPFYGLYNVAEQNGFSSYDTSAYIDDMIAATEEWAITIRASLEHDPLTQAEMNEKSMELYNIWDVALNTLWRELKDRIPEDEFSKLLDEQRAWIVEKEAAMEEARGKMEGGSATPLVVNMKAAEITEKRVYDLYELLK